MIDSILSLWKNKGAVTLSYCISVLFSLIIAVPFYNTILQVSENTLSLNTLVKDFDYMIFTDVTRLYGDALKPYILWFMVLLCVYLIIYSFISGGIIDAVINKKLKLSRFFVQSYRYWGKTLGLGLLLLFLSLILIIVSVSVGVLMQNLIENHNHRSIILVQLPALILFALSHIYLFLIWDYARVLLIKTQNLRGIEAFTRAFNLTLSNFYPLKTLLLIVLLGCAGLGIYLLLDKLIGMTSALTIILMFVFQQLFIYFRGFIRLLNIKLAEIFVSKRL